MIQAMIFAAGLGTRLKPLTDTMPKALVEVGGEPLLQRVLMQLKAIGVGRVVVNVHHFADMIIDFLKANDNFGMDIQVSDERQKLLDTGGGLRHARPLLLPDTPILIHNVDILSNVDLLKFYYQAPLMTCPSCGVPHLRADATLLVSERHTKRYLLFDNQMMLMGWTNIETGQVKSPYAWVRQADAATLRLRLRRFAFSGIHIFNPTLFSDMAEWPDKFSIIDFYLKECARHSIRGYLQKDLKLLDVGKQDTLKEAETFLNDIK